MWYSVPYQPREVRVTEAKLTAIYDAARVGLRGDNLALACGLTPSTYRQLAQLDDRVEMAALKGRADGEMTLARTVFRAAEAGDVDAAMHLLKHRHDWVAKQQVQIDVSQQISVIGALEAAQQRVIDGEFKDKLNAETDLQRLGRTVADVATVESRAR